MSVPAGGGAVVLRYFQCLGTVGEEMATRNVIGRTQLALVGDGGADGGAVLASGLYFAQLQKHPLPQCGEGCFCNRPIRGLVARRRGWDHCFGTDK
jgi:hypothetical protein